MPDSDPASYALPKRKDDRFDKRVSFDHAYHIAHVEQARRILIDETLRPRLVSDRSCLRTRRIQALWLSPNVWANGSIYGTVRFSFDLSTLLTERDIYWVESIDDDTTALRFLLTEVDRTDSDLIDPYDPTSDQGPWRYDVEEETHYRHDDYNLELMFEGELPLDRCEGVDFVNHHHKYCTIDQNSCPYIGELAGESAAEFVGWLIGRNVDPSPLELIEEGAEEMSPTHPLGRAWTWLYRIIDSGEERYRGSVSTPASERALARAIFAAAGRDDQQEVNELRNFFGAPEQWKGACAQLFSETFSLSSPDVLP